LFKKFVLAIVDVYISREGALVAVQSRVVVRRDVKRHITLGSQVFHAFRFYHILKNLLNPAGLKPEHFSLPNMDLEGIKF
jgi:hypothetical protein